MTDCNQSNSRLCDTLQNRNQCYRSELGLNYVFNMRLIASILTFCLVGCGESSSPSTYDDCVLINLSAAQTETAQATVLASCKGKFPPEFNWTEISKKSGHKSWEEVKANPEYQALSKEDQRGAKNQYWTEVLEPFIRSEFQNDGYQQFMAEK